MPLTLADLRTPEGQDVIRQRIRDALEGHGQPVDDWIPGTSGGVENLRLDMVAGGLAELLTGRIANMVNGRFLDFATGDFLKLNARKFYGINANEATKTIQNIALWTVGTPSSKTYNPGDLWVKGRVTGNRYRLIDSGQLSTSNTEASPLNLRFEAENAGSSYADVAGTIDQMVTAPAGVRCVNKRPSDFTDAKLTGVSTGRVSAFYTTPNVAPTYGSVRVRIDTSGEIGSAVFAYSTDGGAFWTTGNPVVPSFEVPGGATLAFANGVSPSFIIGDIFTLLVADAILQRGADAESDESVRNRCRGRWTTLSRVPIGGAVELWAHLASPEVDKVLVDADPSTPGSILVTIASASGPASAAAVIAVQDFISDRLHGSKGVAAAPGFTSPEETVLVSSAIPRQITAGGVVTVRRDKVTHAQAAAETAWLAHLRSLPLGASADAVVRVTELIQAVMDQAGVVDFADAMLNGAGNVVLAAGETAVAADATTLATSLVWRPV